MPSKYQLRVIAGALKGRRLASPDWDGLRPTSDRLRGSLFDVLAAAVPGARVLDGYAGTGAIGIEALSRGAGHVTFVDRDARALALVGENLTRCGVTGGYTVLRADLVAAAGALAAAYDVIVIDPPYASDPAAAVRAVSGALAAGGRLVIEHARRAKPGDRLDGLVRTRTLTAGDSALSFYRRTEDVAEPA